MDFTTWTESLNSIAQLLTGLGVVTILLAYFKHAAERRCWANFKDRTEPWIDELIRTEERHPNELSESQWRYEVEQMLTLANFGPLQTQQLLETAVMVAKGMVNERFL